MFDLEDRERYLWEHERIEVHDRLARVLRLRKGLRHELAACMAAELQLRNQHLSWPAQQLVVAIYDAILASTIDGRVPTPDRADTIAKNAVWRIEWDDELEEALWALSDYDHDDEPREEAARLLTPSIRRFLQRLQPKPPAGANNRKARSPRQPGSGGQQAKGASRIPILPVEVGTEKASTQPRGRRSRHIR